MSSQSGVKRVFDWAPMDLSAKRRSRNYLNSHKDVEKRRRDRINNYLETIRSLLPIYDHLPNQKRMDKADILDMTVIYLTAVNALLENLGVKDVFCAVHQHLDLLNASEDWIQRHRDKYSSVSSFLDAFSNHINAERKRAHRVLAGTVDGEGKSRLYFMEPNLPSGSVRACCPEMDVGIESNKDKGKELVKLNHSPFTRSLSATREVILNKSNGNEEGREHSVGSETNSTMSHSGFQVPDSNVGLLELLKRKRQPRSQGEGTHPSWPMSGNHEHWTSEDDECVDTSNTEQSDWQFGVGVTMQVRDSESVQPGQCRKDTASHSGRPPLTEPTSSSQPRRLVTQQAAEGNHSKFTLLECLPTSAQCGVDDPKTSRLKEMKPDTNSGHEHGTTSRKKCHCNFKIHVRDQGVNTDKSFDKDTQERELTLKVDAGQVELDMGALIRQARAAGDDQCVIPITLKGSVSLQAANTGQDVREAGTTDGNLNQMKLKVETCR